VGFTIAYLLMGTEGAFQPDSYDVSGLWLATSIVLGLIAAVAGGFVCAAVAKSATPPNVLALVVVLLGLAMAVPALTKSAAPQARTGDVGNTEAMQNAKQPAWIVLLNPLLGAVGVLVGARLKRGRGEVV
jgi:uncharacterized membrane protein YeaQ/YmgE (transglycosylase-associated protein family)